MKIALIQMNSKKGNIKSNLTVMTDFIKQASREHADIVVFPEMSLTGYFATKEYLSSALTFADKPVEVIIKLSQEHNLMIIFGIAERKENEFYISQLVAMNGKLIGIYRKHNVINDEANIFTSGKDLPIFQVNDIKVGITICADIDKPDLFESYTKKGCQLIIECASPDLYGDRTNRNWKKGYDWWKKNCIEKIGKYAKKNQIMIAVATQSGRNSEDDFPGGGYMFSQSGELLAETKDYKQKMLLVEI